MDSKIVEKISDALIKRAVGYDTEETVEEYSGSGDDITMVRKKITRKNVPPDISAAKLLLEESDEDDYSLMTDEQLEEEKQRLLKMLKDSKETGRKGKSEDSKKRV